MPKLLRDILALPYDYEDGEGMDFEPRDAFMPPHETQDWLRAWTGNPDADATGLLVFGQDGTGGQAALWIARPGADLLEQPVVFLGSEGELGVVASSVYDYLWLLAGGLGPFEAVAYPAARPVNAAFTSFAESHAPAHRGDALDVLARARAEFPGFEPLIASLCR